MTPPLSSPESSYRPRGVASTQRASPPLATMRIRHDAGTPPRACAAASSSRGRSSAWMSMPPNCPMSSDGS